MASFSREEAIPTHVAISIAANSTPTSPPTARAARTLDLRAADPDPIPAYLLEALLQAIGELRTTIAAQPTTIAEMVLDRLSSRDLIAEPPFAPVVAPTPATLVAVSPFEAVVAPTPAPLVAASPFAPVVALRRQLSSLRRPSHLSWRLRRHLSSLCRRSRLSWCLRWHRSLTSRRRRLRKSSRLRRHLSSLRRCSHLS